MELVIGSYSEPNDAGIHVYQWDSVEGFTNTTNIVGIENPSYLDIEHHARLIYAITEKKDGGVAELHIYQIQAEGALANHLTCIPFPGAGSCYISTDNDKKHAFITNYGDGTLTVIKLPSEMSSGSVVQHLQFLGNGPNEERQDKPHTHAALLSKDEKYLYCTDLGSDRLYRFAYFPEANLPLQAETPPHISLPPGSGPRHFTFSPNGRWLYLITELSGEIFLVDTENLTESWQNRISLLQNGYQGKIEAGDIQVHPNGRFLYASNRGEANEIIVFNVNQENGQISFLQRIGAAGLSPRCLLVCEKENLFLVANEQSDNVLIFTLNTDGTLEFSKEHLQVSCPTCLKIIVRDIET